MLTREELASRANKHQISPMVIFREYCQLLFLKYLSESKVNQHFFFKGGTAIHLLFNGDRFSEDLDFTIRDLSPDKAIRNLELVVKKMNLDINVTMKALKTIEGKSFKLTLISPLVKTAICIKIDLSFRESIMLPTSSQIVTDYPLVFQQLTYHLSKTEIVSEKVRALLHRQKGRDLYDLWFLLSMQADFDRNLIDKKLLFYKKTFDLADFMTKIKSFPKNAFVKDLAPFVGRKKREDLPRLHGYIQLYLNQVLNQPTKKGPNLL